MKNINNISVENLHLEFYASYWNITPEQFECIVGKIGSDDFTEIQSYLEAKLSRNNNLSATN